MTEAAILKIEKNHKILCVDLGGERYGFYNPPDDRSLAFGISVDTIREKNGILFLTIKEARKLIRDLEAMCEVVRL